MSAVDYLAVYDATKGFTVFPVPYSEVARRKKNFALNIASGEYTLKWPADTLVARWKTPISTGQDASLHNIVAEYEGDLRVLMAMMWKVLVHKLTHRRANTMSK